GLLGIGEASLRIGIDDVAVAGVDSLHFAGRQISDLILEIEDALRPESVEHGNLPDCPRPESRANPIARSRVDRDAQDGDIGSVKLVPIGTCRLANERS